jgi:diaminopropionate ammonia-lyase
VNVEKAMFDLERYGVRTGPCGAATLAGLRVLDSLGQDSIVLILCTEGARPYEMKDTGTNAESSQ